MRSMEIKLNSSGTISKIWSKKMKKLFNFLLVLTTLFSFASPSLAAHIFTFTGTVNASSGGWTTHVTDGTSVDIELIYEDDWSFSTINSGLFFDFDGPYGFEMHGNWATEVSGNDDVFDVYLDSNFNEQYASLTWNPDTGTGSFDILGSNDAASGILVSGPSAVPIPAAVWLLGSGLIGLIGIRRKSKN